LGTKREELERREDELLAPYAAKSRYSQGRRYPEPEHPYRTVFQRDRDRIIHCAAFRRLEYKTQVFVNHEGDYYRTRLTHTMEVTQIARTIARAMKLNEDLTEALALSHDLGHTPFGHSGEEALKEEMKDHGGFEHNLQTLRVVELLERRYPEFKGLNLSWETRESICKHTAKAQDILETQYHPEWCPLLECQIVDIADTIAYDAHDIDDSIKAGLIDQEALQEVPLWQIALERVKTRYKDVDTNLMVRQGVLHLIDLEVTDLIESSERELRNSSIKSVQDVREAGRRLIGFSPHMEQQKRRLQEFLNAKVYRHYRVARMAQKAKRFIRELFHEYVLNVEQLPPHFQDWAKEVGIHRAVSDYIAGMTDRYAQDEYKKLFSPFERV
jgi:dGTPase